MHPFTNLSEMRASKIRRRSAAALVTRATAFALFVVGLTAVLPSGWAAPIAAGDLVIFRVGDGSAALSTNATPTFLDEYTPAGALVQTIALPSSGGNALTVVGTATTEGIISRSQDGTTLIFGGYRKDAGGTNPSTDTAAVTNRVIATAGLSGVVNTSVGLTDAGGSMRSATSIDGTTSFYIGTANGVRYVASPGPAATSTLIDSRNSRQVNLSGSTLFASNGSTAAGFTAKVQSYGTLPTGATTPTPVVNLAVADAVNGFSLFDLNTAIPGDDTLYLLSTVENMLRKYAFDGSAWNSLGSILGGGAMDLTGAVSGSDVNLYLTSGSGLFSFTDSSGFSGVLSGALGAAIVPAPANTAFRGMSLIPVPEPSAFFLSSLGLALCGRRARPSRQSAG